MSNKLYSSATIMAWNWVIQYVAKFKEVDSSVLAGLVKKAPAIPDDLGKDAREIVSLKILESLFMCGKEDIVVPDISQNAKISFDPSESCEDVLNKILNETSETMTETEKEKWDVRPFILHKRASLPESPVLKFKEVLLEGDYPLLASLKKKIQSEGIDENRSPVVSFSPSAQNTVAMDNLVSRPGKGNGKRDESILQQSDCTEKDAMSIDPPAEGLDENMPTKHMDPSVSKVLEESCDHTNIAHAQQQPPVGNGVPQETMDSMENLEFAREFKDPEDDILPNASNSRPSGEGNYSMETDSELEAATDGERYVDERSDITAKKHAFVSSQYTLSQDSLATPDGTEICLCMKCNRSGQLLVCGSDACPIRVHESCLGSAAAFDENGIFFCPFCAYSHAISKYLEVKKRASLNRKDLQAFLGSVVKHRPKTSSKKGAYLDTNESREIGAEGKNLEENNNEDTPNRGKEDCAPADSLHQTISSPRKGKPSHNEKSTPMSLVAGQSRRRSKSESPQKFPTITLARRNKLQWSKPEEDMLKKGVKKFSIANNKVIPWKEILDFGHDIFDRSRTTIDLKDKWRNMCKEKEASKKQKL
uniref:uncharacterized protein LOC122608762 n=1 Tax=Erigeron canadensis TaxID=72917 RepID=UPI001CB959AE|nr:uncharacterized protein LOC122608762 [Erigeron canadensis]